MGARHTPRRTTHPLLLLALLATLSSDLATAWNQPTHKAINHQAVEKLKRVFLGARKYRLAPVDFDEVYTGVGVGRATYFAANHTPTRRILPVAAWIVEGGDWADEPQLYASVRHFYDPLALAGVHYLTDQSVAHGRYDQPAVDAATWALRDGNNPFSWHEALVAYKRAMETPEDGRKPGVIQGSHFKLNIPITPRDRAEERGVYLARAYRALGETMHLLADMVQPAHVRNDSHPYDEPVEDNVSAATVRAVAGEPVDAHIAPELTSAGGSRLHLPEHLFFHLASFTNRHFYSSDTVYDQPSGVNPRNQEIPFPRPQFRDLLRRKVTIGGEELDAWTAPLVNDTIPLATAGLYWYYVPPAFAKDQARVLIPIAIHAAADLMHQFFPTLELEGRFGDPELLVDEVGGKRAAGHQVVVEGTMVHHVDQDQAWEDEGLSISYSGAADLVFERSGRVRRKIPLAFEAGRLVRAEDEEGEMTAGALNLYLRQGRGPALAEAEAHTAVEDGDTVYVRVKAGSRSFTGPKLYYSFPVERVEAEYEDLGLRQDKGAPGMGIRRIAVTAATVNRGFPARSDGQQLAPAYTGPVDLAFVDEEGRLRKTVPLWFEEGELTRISDARGRLVAEPLVLYGDESSTQKLSDLEKLYQVEPRDTVSLVLWVDDERLIRSNGWTYGVESGEVDGTYDGTLRLGGTEKLREAVVTVVALGFYPIAQAVAKATDSPPMTYSQVREAVDGATTSNTAEVPITLTVVATSGTRVDVDMTLATDGGETRVTGAGTFSNGELRFSVRFRDGSELEMTGRLQGATLVGTATATAWGVVGGAAEGSWAVRRR